MLCPDQVIVTLKAGSMILFHEGAFHGTHKRLQTMSSGVCVSLSLSLSLSLSASVSLSPRSMMFGHHTRRHATKCGDARPIRPRPRLAPRLGRAHRTTQPVAPRRAGAAPARGPGCVGRPKHSRRSGVLAPVQASRHGASGGGYQPEQMGRGCCGNRSTVTARAITSRSRHSNISSR